jgi:hypothetical protein
MVSDDDVVIVLETGRLYLETVTENVLVVSVVVKDAVVVSDRMLETEDDVLRLVEIVLPLVMVKVILSLLVTVCSCV